MADPTVSELAAGGSASAKTTCSFSAPAAGTLMVLVVAADDYVTTSGDGRPESTSWTRASTGTDWIGAYVWYKLANGTESSVDYTIGSATYSAYALIAATNIDQTTPLDVSPSPTHTHNDASAEVPTASASLTSGRRLALGCFSAGRPDNVGMTSVSSWTNSYVEVAVGSGSPANPRWLAGVAALVRDGGASTSTTATLSANPQCAYGVTLGFKVASGDDATVDAPTTVAATAAVDVSGWATRDSLIVMGGTSKTGRWT